MLDNVLTKKRKPRGEPRFYYGDPGFREWVVKVHLKHPEVLARIQLTDLIETLIKSVPEKKIQIGPIPIPAEELLWMIEAIPGRPNTSFGEYFNSDGWDAWFLWYNLMLKCGIIVTPRDVAKLTGRPLDTVKSEFRRAGQDILKVGATTTQN